MRSIWRTASFLLATSIAAIYFPADARAATVSVSPADSTVIVDTEFWVQITTDAVSDLKGMQLIFSYDPAMVSFLGASAGDVLTGSGRAYSTYLVPDTAPADSVWYDAAMLDGSTSGPGIIAFFHFKALNIPGDTAIGCVHVDFRDSNNVPLAPGCTGGVVHISGPTAANRFSWGLLKTLYR